MNANCLITKSQKLWYWTIAKRWRSHCVFVTVLFQFLNHVATAKTVNGVFNTYVAQAAKGQYVKSFAFHGDVVLNLMVNTVGTVAKLFLFVSEDLKDAVEDEDCQCRFAKARALVVINGTVGHQPVFHYLYCCIWHLVYTDTYTCEPGRPKEPEEEPNFIKYSIQLLNPDSLGNPTEHFGDQETVFDMLSQFTMLFMLLSLPLGWSLASAHSVCRYSHPRYSSQKPTACVVFRAFCLCGKRVRTKVLKDHCFSY